MDGRLLWINPNDTINDQLTVRRSIKDSEKNTGN